MITSDVVGLIDGDADGIIDGLYVNGQRTGRAFLANGDVLSIGRTQMRFEC